MVGGVGYTVKQLREVIHELKDGLKDKNAPYGVDLLLPQVGGSARKTNVSTHQAVSRPLADIDATLEIVHWRRRRSQCADRRDHRGEGCSLRFGRRSAA